MSRTPRQVCEIIARWCPATPRVGDVVRMASEALRTLDISAEIQRLRDDITGGNKKGHDVDNLIVIGYRFDQFKKALMVLAEHLEHGDECPAKSSLSELCTCGYAPLMEMVLRLTNLRIGEIKGGK